MSAVPVVGTTRSALDLTGDLIEAADALAAALQTLRIQQTPVEAERVASHLAGMYRVACLTRGALYSAHEGVRDAVA